MTIMWLSCGAICQVLKNGHEQDLQLSRKSCNMNLVKKKKSSKCFYGLT